MDVRTIAHVKSSLVGWQTKGRDMNIEHIEHINGLTVERIGGKRVVSYNGQVCPLIKREEELCECDTSYKGDVLDSWESYATPIGVVERHYWARGPGLERSGTDWRIVPVAEIDAAQKRFEAASRELAAARAALEMVTHQ